MLAALHGAGWVSWFAVAAMLAGLGFVLSVGRSTGRPGSVAAAWSVVIFAVALLNASAGQRKVDDGVRGQADPASQIAMLSQGTREASSNLFVGGTCALCLMALGGILTLGRRPLDSRGNR